MFRLLVDSADERLSVDVLFLLRIVNVILVPSVRSEILAQTVDDDVKTWSSARKLTPAWNHDVVVPKIRQKNS